MIVDVALTPAAFEFGQTDGRVVVVDVLRASCTIITALGNGADRVIPVGSVEEATITSYSCGAQKDELLLCGERGGERIEGFSSVVPSTLG